MPQEQVADLRDALSDAILITIDAGHLVHATEPVPFVDAVTAFLDAEPRDGW